MADALRPPRVSYSDVVAAYTRARPTPARSVPVAVVHEIRRRVIVEGEKQLAVAVSLSLHPNTVKQIVRGRRRAEVPPDDALTAWLEAHTLRS